jgi:hypothetical protein
MRTDVADAAPSRSPNKPLAFLLLFLVVGGSLVLIGMGTWLLLHEDRLAGFAWFSLGLVWFLFSSWILRAVLKPGPTG